MTSQAIGRQKDFKEATVYMTAKSTQHLLANRGNRAFETLGQPDENYPTIMIDIDKTFQAIEGFGGAFTDASAIVFAKLPKDKQQEFLDWYARWYPGTKVVFKYTDDWSEPSDWDEYLLWQGDPRWKDEMMGTP